MSEKQPTFETDPADGSERWPTYQSSEGSALDDGEEPASDGDQGRAVALRSLRRKREFWMHCATYVIVNGSLVVIWLIIAMTTGAWFFWPIYPIAGWGIGLAFHAVSAYGRSSGPITEPEIQKEMQRLLGASHP